jgi:hypothetical protein
MNRLFENARLTVISQLHITTRKLVGLLAMVAILSTVSCSDTDQATTELNVGPALGQAVFAAPEDAANAFVVALQDADGEELRKLLGADYASVLSLENVDGEDVENYINAWEESNTLLPQGEHKVLIAIGKGDWTLPIPVVEGASGWYFDIDEGRERIGIRRIGRNELSAMQVVLAYYDAQMEYARQDRDGNGMLEYAKHFISTPGTHDGLVWEDEDGGKLSPLGPMIADDTPGGGYFGYFYRILHAQGESARDGAYSYLLGDKMRAGFALIAWPEEYGESGVMSFMVSHAGIVYEQNLGPDSAQIAKEMPSYNPDEGWLPSKEVSGPKLDAAQ